MTRIVFILLLPVVVFALLFDLIGDGLDKLLNIAQQES